MAGPPGRLGVVVGLAWVDAFLKTCYRSTEITNQARGAGTPELCERKGDSCEQ